MKSGCMGVAAVAAPRIVEIDYIEFRLHCVSVQMVQQMVVGNGRKVGKLEVVDIHRVALFDLLLDKVIDHGIGLSAARCSEYDCCAERIYDIDPTSVPSLAIVEARGQIYRVFVGQETCFLLKGFVFVIEHIIHQIVFQKTARP